MELQFKGLERQIAAQHVLELLRSVLTFFLRNVSQIEKQEWLYDQRSRQALRFPKVVCCSYKFLSNHLKLIKGWLTRHTDCLKISIVNPRQPLSNTGKQNWSPSYHLYQYSVIETLTSTILKTFLSILSIWAADKAQWASFSYVPAPFWKFNPVIW